MDPIVTGAVVKVGEFGGKVADSAAKEAGGLLSRLFGPSADVIGLNWAERLRERNLKRLLRKTEAHGVDQDGFANPRVASQVFESAEYADSEVVAEYLSGVLASSRHGEGTDDSGVQWSAVIARLSSDQLRLHYLLYASIRPAVVANPPAKANELHLREMVLPFQDVLNAGEFETMSQFANALDGLMREGLIEVGYRYGPTKYVFEREAVSHKITFLAEAALRVTFSIHGLWLYLWGCGAVRLESDTYVDPNTQFTPAEPEKMPARIEGVEFVESFLAPLESDPPVVTMTETGP